MSDVATTPTAAQRSGLRNWDQLSMEDLLTVLSAFGRPYLGQIDTGWYCRVTMRVAAKGTEFTVSSDFAMRYAMSALTQCAERVNAAISQWEARS